MKLFIVFVINLSVESGIRANCEHFKQLLVAVWKSAEGTLMVPVVLK